MSEQATSGISNLEVLVTKMIKYNETLEKSKAIFNQSPVQFFTME